MTRLKAKTWKLLPLGTRALVFSLASAFFILLFGSARSRSWFAGDKTRNGSLGRIRALQASDTEVGATTLATR